MAQDIDGKIIDLGEREGLYFDEVSACRLELKPGFVLSFAASEKDGKPKFYCAEGRLLDVLGTADEAKARKLDAYCFRQGTYQDIFLSQSKYLPLYRLLTYLLRTRENLTRRFIQQILNLRLSEIEIPLSDSEKKVLIAASRKGEGIKENPNAKEKEIPYQALPEVVFQRIENQPKKKDEPKAEPKLRKPLQHLAPTMIERVEESFMLDELDRKEQEIAGILAKEAKKRKKEEAKRKAEEAKREALLRKAREEAEKEAGEVLEEEEEPEKEIIQQVTEEERLAAKGIIDLTLLAAPRELGKIMEIK